MKRGSRLNNKKKSRVLACALASVAWTAHGAPIPATEDGKLGLYSARDFRITDGSCGDCQAVPQALWYFNNEPLAVPVQHAADFSRGTRAQADVAAWAANNPDLAAQPVVWLGSSSVIPQAQMSVDGKTVTLDEGNTLDFNIVPKVPSNLSYWNDDTQKFFSQRPVRLRGESGETGFVARTVWPLDYRISAGGMAKPLDADESLKSLVQYENGGAQSAYQARLLWESSPGAAENAAGKAVVGLMLNGAQGDDDEAHGGHFGVVTGRFEADGNWSRWLVNNFYNLDSISEKAIIAAATPVDKYLMDLNSGQSYYRPSYMLVATFKSDRPAALYQGAINRVYQHLYRHDFVYDHSRDNCAGISIDTFRTLGWRVPERGVEGYAKATAAWFYVAASERSLGQGRKLYDYLTTETSRLYPAVTFDAMGNDLLALAQGRVSRKLTPLEQQLAQDIEAIWFVRIPQIPSSRAYGLAPVYGFDQYMKQAPADRSEWKIIPVADRPFPDKLRDGLALKHKTPSPVPLPVAGAGLGLCLIVAWLGRRWLKRRQSRDPSTLEQVAESSCG
jgi:GNAT superfamily N-acetyltransferase